MLAQTQYFIREQFLFLNRLFYGHLGAENRGKLNVVVCDTTGIGH
jgi:hypothetical protein